MEKLHSDKLSPKTTTAPTQKYLDVSEIKDDVIVLKSGTIRSVLAVSAINFDLKSTEEQEAIISQYQNFLNSIDFPIQILINSRKINMQNYSHFLTEKEKNQPIEILRHQIAKYREFINQLVSVSNIMEKNFYIIVPFSPIENTEKGFFSNIGSLLNPQKNILEKRENFRIYRNQLFQRVDHVIAALSGIGLNIIPLKTEELIELMFDSYNPQVYNANNIKDIQGLEITK